MQKTTLYIVRHGQTEWNVQKKMQGHKDSALTELGESQAQWLYESLNNVEFDGIYTSSSLRAVRTAEIISGEQKVAIIRSDQLKEINLGEWEGQIQEDIEKKDPERFKSFWKTPHLFKLNSGESFIEVQNRVLPELKDIISNHIGRNILIVTHTVVVKILMAYFEERALSDIWNPPYIHPTSLCKVVIEEDQPFICLHGDISHYKQQITESY
ncbi:histidine phosphatase family protein [Lysinibacillus fusiformis]|uniref:histidine phosphatase family protein n=1 Tax=Lysinibacillus fusiformis TaxID=28031 RepID=UPI003AAF29D4